jgi:hypothetical protein
MANHIMGTIRTGCKPLQRRAPTKPMGKRTRALSKIVFRI